MRLSTAFVLVIAASAPARTAPKEATPPTRFAKPVPQRDLAGNRLEPLAKLAPRSGDDEGPRTLCTPAPRFCVRTITARFSGTAKIEILKDRSPAAVAGMEFAPGGDRSVLEPWPFVVRLAEPNAVLLGVTEDTTTGYSGGGGTSSTLNLLRVARDGPRRKWAVRVILSMPISGYLMIRACFGENDMRDRRGACHDEYSFHAGLTLATTTRAGKPRFVVDTLATTYPGDVRRDSDSRAAGPLKRGDLIKRRDPECSYRRILTANGAWDYLPDRDFPDCTSYTVP